MNPHELLASLDWVKYETNDTYIGYINPDETLLCDVWLDHGHSLVMCAVCHLENVTFDGPADELATYLANGCPDTAHDCVAW